MARGLARPVSRRSQKARFGPARGNCWPKGPYSCWSTDRPTGKGRFFPLLVNLPPKVNGYPYFLLLHLKERPK